MLKQKFNTLAISITALCCIAAPVSQVQASTEAKQGLSFVSGAVIGASVGGPVGFIIGALSGTYVADKIKQSDQAEGIQMDLSQAHSDIQQLQQQLAATEQHAAELAQFNLEALQLENWFATGSDQLSFNDKQQLQNVANFLINNPDLQLNLNGHADSRGTDEYNNVLSLHRAINVKDVLVSYGVEVERISSTGHGAQYAKDGVAHAENRRVELQFISPLEQTVATN